MADIGDRLINLPLSVLKKRRAMRGRLRGPYKRHLRTVRSREQLVDYLRERGFRTRDQMRAGRREGDPHDNDYVKVFGSWRTAMDAIWREERLKFTRRYLVQSIVEFKLWTADAYRSARAKRPDVLAPFHVVLSEFGSWGSVKEIAMVFSFKETLVAYAELKERLGKTPTLKDCRHAKVEIGKVLGVFDDKRDFDNFISSLEGVL